jgi:hypothetical protein
MFLVYEDGAMRAWYRYKGEWQTLCVAVHDASGYSPAPGVTVKETGVYAPTHWMPLPAPPALTGDVCAEQE